MAVSVTETIKEYQNIVLDRTKSTISAYGGESLSQYGINKSQWLVQQALKNHIEHVNEDTCEAGEEDTFFVADLGNVYRQHLRWKTHLGRIKPHYGMFEIITHM